MPSPKKFLSFFLFLSVFLLGLVVNAPGYGGVAEKFGAGELSGPVINKVLSDPILMIGIAIVVIVLISKMGNIDLTFLLKPLIALLSARTSPTTTLPTIPGLPPLPAPTTNPATPTTPSILDYLPYLLQLFAALRAKGDTEGADAVKRLIDKA